MDEIQNQNYQFNFNATRWRQRLATFCMPLPSSGGQLSFYPKGKLGRSINSVFFKKSNYQGNSKYEFRKSLIPNISSDFRSSPDVDPKSQFLT